MKAKWLEVKQFMKKYLLNSNNIVRDSFLWNMLGSMLNAFQSVIILMVITRTCNLNDAGVFTIAYANANLFMYIGKYGMRNYQVSDVSNQFSFSDYYVSRIITNLIMMVLALVYVLYIGNSNGYAASKSICIICMCVYKGVDCIEDVYHGLYQHNNRLDIAGKCMTIRMVVTILCFAIALILSKSLLISLVVATICTIVVYEITNVLAYSIFPEKRSFCVWKNVCDLMLKCFPLFLGTFLSFYIGNAPKYMIDIYLNDEAQACYGFIAMPIFVISMLNGFVFNPMISKMSYMWDKKDLKGFNKMFLGQNLIVVVITFVCEVGAYVLGIPVLSILYNTDLSEYKVELLILLMGGGFLALSGLYITILTIIRHQNIIGIVFLIVAIVVFLVSPQFVKKYEILGASILYLLSMCLISVMFVCVIVLIIKKAKKVENCRC